MNKILDNMIDKTLDVFFAKDKTGLYIFFTFILGFILRLINVINLPTSVDASGHALTAVNFIASNKIGTPYNSTALWHFLTDLAYKIFGINDICARFFVLIFGSFSIILIFLFVKEIFNKHVGLIAAFILAVSPYHITETISEMDVMVMFFIIFSMWIFTKALKENRKVLFLISGLLLGTGILIKIYAVLFIPTLILFAVYYNHKYKINVTETVKNILIFCYGVGIFCLVPIVYNYLLYEDKGYMDQVFSDTLGIGKEKSDQFYSWIVPYRHEYLAFFFGGSKISSTQLPIFIATYLEVLKIDIIIFLFAIIGIILIILKKENKDYLVLLLFSLLTYYLYIGSVTGLMIKHYLILTGLFIPFSAYALYEISKTLENSEEFFRHQKCLTFFSEIKIKNSLIILLLVILIFQLFWIASYTNGNFYEKSSMNKLVNYKSNIPGNSIVIYDSRIFRGIGTYIFSDKHYLESAFFSQLLNSQEKLSGIVQPTEIYFIECISDDCGWGTIKDQPDFNKSMEEVVNFFKSNSQIIKSIESKNKVGLNSPYKIYKTTINLKQSSYDLVDSTHIFWGIPLGYNEKFGKGFDNYIIKGIINLILDKIAHLIFYFAAVIAISSLFWITYLFINTKNEEN